MVHCPAAMWSSILAQWVTPCTCLMHCIDWSHVMPSCFLWHLWNTRNSMLFKSSTIMAPGGKPRWYSIISLSIPSDQEWGGTSKSSSADISQTLRVTLMVKQYASCHLAPSNIMAEECALLGSSFWPSGPSKSGMKHSPPCLQMSPGVMKKIYLLAIHYPYCILSS